MCNLLIYELIYELKAQLKYNLMSVKPCISLQTHAYSNILRIIPPKNENFQMKNSGSFNIFAQKIDCRY